MTPPSRVRRNTPTTRFAAAAIRRMISASTSPLSAAHEPRQGALAVPSSSPAAPVRRNSGASPSPDQSMGRTSGNPSESLPARSIRRDFGEHAAGREFPVRTAHHLARALDRAQQAAQRRAVGRPEPEGAGDLAGGQRLGIGTQKRDELAIGRQPGAGTRVAGATAGHRLLAATGWPGAASRRNCPESAPLSFRGASP